jgi:hypothetical protein
MQPWTKDEIDAFVGMCMSAWIQELVTYATRPALVFIKKMNY